MNDDNSKATTTDAGIPVASDEYSLTVGPDGPNLLQDHYLIEQMANFCTNINLLVFGHNLQASRDGDSAGNRDGNEIRAIRD